MNSSHRREVELKKNRFIAAKQRPVSTGKLQIWAAVRQKKNDILFEIFEMSALASSSTNFSN